MPANHPYVIVGAMLTGAKAAETLREEGFDGAVVLIGTEDQLPYERPPLSKGYLLGKDARDSFIVHDEGWYSQNNVDLRRGTTVASIDRSGHRVTLDGGESVPYEKLLISTGASPRRLDIPGGDLDGVHYLRTVGDSESLSAALRGGGRRARVRVRGHDPGAGIRRPAAGAGPRGRRDLRRPAPQPRGDVPVRRGPGRGDRLRRRRIRGDNVVGCGTARAYRHHRGRRRAEHRARRRRRPRGRQRHRGRPATAHL